MWAHGPKRAFFWGYWHLCVLSSLEADGITFTLLTWCSCDPKILKTFKKEILTQSGKCISLWVTRERGGAGEKTDNKKHSQNTWFSWCLLPGVWDAQGKNLNFWKNNLTFSWVAFTANKPTLTQKQSSLWSSWISVHQKPNLNNLDQFNQGECSNA